MGVEATPPDHVAAGWRQRDLAAAGQQRPGQQDRGADPRAQNRIEVGGANGFGMDRQRIARAPFGRRADRADQLHQRLGVANARHVLKRHRMLGQQRRGDDRQRGVLVAGRLDRAGKPVSPLDHVLDRGGRPGCRVTHGFRPKLELNGVESGGCEMHRSTCDGCIHPGIPSNASPAGTRGPPHRCEGSRLRRDVQIRQEASAARNAGDGAPTQT